MVGPLAIVGAGRHYNVCHVLLELRLVPLSGRAAAGAALILVTGLAAGGWLLRNTRADGPHRPSSMRELMRAELFAEIQPVALANCDMQRFGEPHDGGYLMCANLLDEVVAGYSYGIAGYDGWGCDISTRYAVPVHQYDCFDLTRPVCPSGETIFHAECVAGRRFTDGDGRVFDSIQAQLTRNGDGANRIVLKIDVEGAEWESFLMTPDEVLERIDQIAVEFHGVHGEEFIHAVRRLKEFFHVAHLHFNNYACRDDLAPFPAEAFEMLFVSRRLGVVDPSREVRLPHPLDTPTNPKATDCQAVTRR